MGIVAEYDYTDESGELLFQAVRMEPKKFSQRHRNGGTDWVWSLEGVRRVPYRLPKLLEGVKAGRVIFVVEGEKDVDKLTNADVVATCNPMGAGKWDDSYSALMKDAKRVIVVPDNDEPGRNHATAVAASLRAAGVADVRILLLPGLTDKGDVSDWLHTGNSIQDFKMLASQAAIVNSSVPARNGSSKDLNEFTRPRNGRLASVTYPILKDEALHGLARDVVHAIEPHTESDPVAILLQFLVMFGNVIGRNAHYLAESDRHYSNQDLVLVGETSKGRKGTSFGRVNSLFEHSPTAETWASGCVAKGLSSGEGLIWRIRDEIKGTDKDGTEDVKVAGIDDKRLLVVESEFASTLKVASREGNTLSAVIRDAWDGRPLSTLTKNSPTRCDEPHVSIIGHITRDELLRYLDDTSYANGFGNRFLWASVRRSKVLPDGGHLDDAEKDQLSERLSVAIAYAQNVGRMQRTESAKAIWHAVYPELSEGSPGLVGALKGRAEAHVVRLATLFALLDLSDTIDTGHMLAALSVWDYVSDSVDYIFGDTLGDPQADAIYRALATAPNGLTRTEISKIFQRNVSAARIENAVGVLVDRGMVEVVEEKTKGRSVNRVVLSTK